MDKYRFETSPSNITLWSGIGGHMIHKQGFRFFLYMVILTKASQQRQNFVEFQRVGLFPLCAKKRQYKIFATLPNYSLLHLKVSKKWIFKRYEPLQTLKPKQVFFFLQNFCGRVMFFQCQLPTFVEIWNCLRKIYTGIINSNNSAILFGALEYKLLFHNLFLYH